MLTSYLLQASEHRGLQVQNNMGQWIDCPPIRGTLVVAIGQGLEALTQGVCQRYYQFALLGSSMLTGEVQLIEFSAHPMVQDLDLAFHFSRELATTQLSRV